ncbi:MULTISPECIES: hypothetical protein [unclassified Nonomuraea]|uniref:hypothetical protein n=1 Tax=unclassified Nonomuraea TaxID=2593643 RepID=UPI0035BEF982
MSRPAHGPALVVAAGEGEHVGGAALDPDRGQGAAARAGVGTGQDPVAEVVAQDRLHPVDQVAHQGRVRQLARRDRPVVGVDRPGRRRGRVGERVSRA